MKDMTIGGLAGACAVGVETVRYYQRRGLLAEPERGPGRVRRYGADAVARLRFIRRAQDVGFTLEEVRELIKLGETPNCRGARALAARKLERVEARLGDLQRVRAALKEMVESCDAGRERRCPIIEELARFP
jgi:MerR family transcriptional regulator, mercuric resistance operon regulatory protein